MSDFPNTAVGLPSQLQYVLPPSLPDECRSYSVSISPNGVTSVTGSSAIPVVYVANGANMPSYPFNSQQLCFDIPCGMNADTFLDPRETMLNFRMVLTSTGLAQGATPNAAQAFNLISSAASWIENLTLVSNNQPLESIQNYNLLHAMLLNSSVSPSERLGGTAICMGTNETFTTGVSLPILGGVAGTQFFFNFCIPLVSIVGLNSQKLIPVGSIQSLQLQITTATTCPFASYVTGTLAATNVIGFAAPVLDGFSLNMKYVSVGSMAAQMLKDTLVDNKWYIKSQTYVSSNSTLPIATAGSVSQMYQIRNSSVKSLFIAHTTAPSAVCPNGQYDAINPNATSCQLKLAGMSYPQKPLNPSQRPAESFASFIGAFGGGSNFKDFGGAISRSGYGASLNQGVGYDTMMTLPALGKRSLSSYDILTATAFTTIVNYPNSHYTGFDLDRCTGSNLFSGQNTRSAPPYVELTISNALPVSVQSFAFALVDVVLAFEPAAKYVSVYN